MKTLRKAVTNTQPCKAVSSKYKFISTIDYIQPFLKRGWVIDKQKGGVKATSAHQISLTHPDFKTISGDKIQILVLNSHDRSMKFTVAGGLFRLVCSNGLMVGEDFEAFSFKHIGNNIEEKLENSYEKLVAKLETMKKQFEALESTILEEEVVRNKVLNIASKLLNTSSKKKKVEVEKVTNLIPIIHRISRGEDVGQDAFTKMNIIQENITRRYGLGTVVKVTEFDDDGNVVREFRTTKGMNPVEDSSNVRSIFKVNSAITNEFLKEVA